LKSPQDVWPDLRSLSALGFSPDAVLMNDPKLFVDRRFLAALLSQLHEELGDSGARNALFQIGLLHGLRDAERVLRGEFLPLPSGLDAVVASSAAASTPLAMRLGARRVDTETGSLTLPGSWPECYEADARLSRLGPMKSPGCALSAGYTSGWLSGTLEANVIAVEERCLACGDSECRFVAREAEGWRSSGDPRAAELARFVDFQRFREVARMGIGGFPHPDGVEDHIDFDADEPVVHVWGPVMVMPFTGADDALHAIEMLSRDPATEDVCVVVIDLRDAIIDEGFGAAALEQVVSVIDSWGAEAILAGVSPLSEAAVAGVEVRHLLVRKDLPEAIAVAFQIAEAQTSTQ